MIRRIALTAIIACAFGGPADAGTGTLFKGPATGAMVNSWGYEDTPPGEVKQSAVRSAYLVRKSASCVVAKYPNEAKAFLSLTPSGPGYGGEADKIMRRVVDDCMVDHIHNLRSLTLRMPISNVRGVLAEAFLRSWPRPQLAAIDQIRPSYAAWWTSRHPEDVVVEEMASCLSETHPQSVVALISTKPGSEEEKSALAELIPHVEPCLSKGTTLKTGTTSLRFALALGLYHRVMDSTPASASPAIRSSVN